jgi:glycosyltransferase involved in cell wall biosynthesis
MPYQWGRPSWKGPIVVTVVDMIYEKFPQYFVNAAQVIETKKRCIEKADRVIAISNSTKRDILEYFNIPEDKVVVTHLAGSNFFKELPESDNNEFKEQFKLGKHFILYVGHRGGYKNFQMLLKTYSLWKRKNDFDLICVGGASKWARDENELITQANLGDSVRLFPNAADEELRAFYSCAQAFVYPSLYEGFGIPPLEAMACGTPVIVSNTSSLPEVVGDAGLYFDPSSKEQLLDALDRIVYDTNLREELVRKGLNRSKMFSWQETATKTHSIYRDLL